MAVSTLCRVASVISSEGIVPLVSVYIFLHGIDGPLYRAYPEYLPVTAISETNRKRTKVFSLKKEKEKKEAIYSIFSQSVVGMCSIWFWYSLPFGVEVSWHSPDAVLYEPIIPPFNIRKLFKSPLHRSRADFDNLRYCFQFDFVFVRIYVRCLCLSVC